MHSSTVFAGIVAGSLFIVASTTARADLLTAGARSGSVSVSVYGQNSGPIPGFDDEKTGSVPATGAGNVSVTASGLDSASGSADVNLNTVSGGQYSLSADATYTYYASQDNDLITVGYSFSQSVVISQAVPFSLSLTVGSGSNWDSAARPTITFTGPGVNDSATNTGGSAPSSQTTTYSGTLQPGTYTFSSTWSSGPQYFEDGSFLTGGFSRTNSVSALLSVPEPTTAMLASPLLLTLLRRRRTN